MHHAPSPRSHPLSSQSSSPPGQPRCSRPPVARYRVVVVERTAGGSLTATLTATRRRYTTIGALECTGAGARPEVSTYRGTSPGKDRWLEWRGQPQIDGLP